MNKLTSQFTDECSVSIYLRIYGSTTLVLLGRFLSFITYKQSVGLLGRGISPSEALYLHTEQNKHKINASSGIRTHDSSVGEREEG
jgi:hypothetical protein